MSKQNPTSGDYEVGYGKPPKNTQFQKGASGNPTGRPKKARDLDTALVREANSLITINENGQRTRLSKHEVVVKQLLQNAMKGKPSDVRTYFAHYPQAFEKIALLVAEQEAELRKGARDFTDDELTEMIRKHEDLEKKQRQSGMRNIAAKPGSSG